MRYHRRFLSLLIVVLLAWGPAGAARARGCFRIYEPHGRQPVTFLCQNQTYWIRNCAPPSPGTPIVYDRDSRDGLCFLGSNPCSDTSTVLLVTMPPGRTRITQLINSTPNIDSLSAPYPIYPTTAPIIRVDVCLRSAQVLLLDPTYDHYSVSFTLGNGVPQAQTKVQGELAYSGLLNGTAAGTIRIQVTGVSTNARLCPSVVRDTVIQIAAQPPAPRIRFLDVLAPTKAGQVRLKFDRLTAGTAYILERAPAAGTTWTPLDVVAAAADTASRLLTNAPTRSIHRYRLRVRNGTCDPNATAPTPPVLSAEVAAMPLRVAAINKKNVLTWDAWAGTGTINAYAVYRNGQQITRLPGTTRTFTDPNVTCLRRYCYEVSAQVLLVGDTLQYFTADSCVVGISTTPPAAPTKFRASFDLQNNLVLTAVPAPNVNIAQLNFAEQPRSTGGPVAVGTSPTTTLVLPTPDTTHVRQQCYSATLTDSCGLTSAMSPTGCPTVLRVSRNGEKTLATLNWTSYSGFPSQARYRVQLLDDRTNAIVFDTLVDFRQSYVDNLRGNQRQVRRYRIRAEFARDTFAVSFSNVVDLVDEAFIRLPNAFTPNGDGLNDTFGPTGRYELRETELVIYDRWGKLLFQTLKPNEPWDGRAAGGDIVPPGVYVYLFRGRDAGGRQYNQRGTVTVMR